jgi:autotransporter-associated beta strand protein
MHPRDKVSGRPKRSVLGLIGAALCLLAASVAPAQTTVYWDSNGSATGSSNTTNLIWQQSSGSYFSTNSAGTSSTTTWSSVASGSKTAVFSAGTNATGTSEITVTGTINDVGGLNFSEGNVTLKGAGTLTLSGSPTITVAGTASGTISASIGPDGWAGFTKAGTGNLTLSGSNTFDAPVTVSAGTLTLAHSNALGNNNPSWGNTVSSGATLALQNDITITEGQFSISGTGVSNGGALRNVSGNNTLNGSLGIAGATSIVSNTGTLTTTGQIDLGSNTLTVSGSGNTTFSGDINNSGALTKTGTGTLTLSGSGANSNTGAITVTQGTLALDKTDGTNAIGGATVTVGDNNTNNGTAILRLEGNNQIADYSGLITLNSDGTLQVNNFTESINTLAGTGLIDLSTSGYLTVGANSGSSSFGGSISGTGTIDKVGSGTLTLTSNLDFGGTLEVSAGTLAYTSDRLFDATLKLDGGTLLLTNADVSVTTLLVTANSIIDFGGTASSLSLANFTISNGVTLTIQNWANATDFFFTQNWTGASYNITGSNPMTQVVFSGFTANDTKWLQYEDSHGSGYHQITPVPEPSTYGALLLGSLAAALGLRRRLQKARN